ncbi:MAG: TIR domain-containing protein, partial [Acidobacteriota bacterium]
MKDSLATIRALIARDRLVDALDACERSIGGRSSEIADELVALRARLESTRRDARRGMISSADEAVGLTRIRFALLAILDELSDVAGTTDDDRDDVGAGDEPGRSVFISYNHADGSAMEALADALREAGVEVWVDRTHLAAGEPIETFIRRAIRETSTTLSLVSSRSLLSDWVAMETLGTLAAETFTGRRRLVAGFLDGDSFAPGFRLDATDRIDERLTELDRLAVAHRERQLDTRDLDHQRNRLIRLRNGLGDILDRFRNALMVD